MHACCSAAPQFTPARDACSADRARRDKPVAFGRAAGRCWIQETRQTPASQNLRATPWCSSSLLTCWALLTAPLAIMLPQHPAAATPNHTQCQPSTKPHAMSAPHMVCHRARSSRSSSPHLMLSSPSTSSSSGMSKSSGSA
eukprot:456186-Rhodomonas_salina.4